MNLLPENFSESEHTLGKPDDPDTHERCTVYTYSSARVKSDVVRYKGVLLYQVNDNGWGYEHTKIHDAIVKRYKP